MMKYDSDYYSEIQFINMKAEVEFREDGQWIDIFIGFEVAPNTPLSDEMKELSALLICNAAGHIVQWVVLDAGCDSEYQFTPDEKAQLTAFAEGLDLQRQFT
ncbi:hypothetical protein SY83_17540 [Paenibacillus swuensis]|uniref:Uncharacterized protein n=1 Tax=Paenibacillus swuensis TaxID=1178515 RepID=A0A172TL72_9BACL|nr:hypothetical protein [Paenibacillus swuensis]ANE47788.1 hypothetical protein SY83_17540 [Paenibacillus swuensis]